MRERTAAREGNSDSLPAVDRSGWRTTRRTIDLEKPVLMGILNVTPDSFSDGGRYFDRESALRQLDALQQGGADIIDVGGESTRPGSAPVDTDEELRRVIPVIEAAVDRVSVPISIDTTKATVARAALDAGAEIVNDISGLRFDPELAGAVAEAGAGLVVMHIRGQPRTMQQDTRYDDLIGEVAAELGAAADRALAAGCDRETIAVDPGIGFGKSAQGNLTLINQVDRFVQLGYPVLVGPSRKSFIGKVLDLDVGDRVEATLAACVVAYMRGARIYRVHDVQPARRALDMANAIAERGSGAESD